VLDDGRRHRVAVGYAELVGNFDAHAKRLLAEGLLPGDRCGLQAPQGRGFVEIALGILAAGGCLAPIPEDHVGAALDEVVERSKLHRIVREEPSGMSIEALPAPGPVDGGDDSEYRALDPAFLRFTSGTTNRRKGVLLGHDAILARTTAANRALAIGPTDRVLWLLPMAHHFVVSILLYLREGATLLLPSSSLARPVLDLAAEAGATVLYASPHHFGLLAKDPGDRRPTDVRLAISTADGLRADTAEAFHARFGFRVVQALGIIEVGLPIANLASPHKPTSLGRPLPDYTLQLLDESGLPIEGPTSPERTGEICVTGPGMLSAYVDPWMAGDSLARDGFRTGDQGYLDADGDLFLVGRRANRISMAGMKFFGEEVEAVLDTHPGVLESRVFARDHAHLGQIPVAEFVPVDASAPPDRSGLSRHCRGKLPPYKVPRSFTPVDRLARTSSGKLIRASDAD
jgi:long-chain acyl-CoA synthetase